MFIDLISSIKLEVIKILFTVQLRDESQDNKDKEILDKMVSDMGDSIENHSTNYDEHIPVIEKKIARNEPCPCGSGKKYKQCHGKSGPKRGILSGA